MPHLFVPLVPFDSHYPQPFYFFYPEALVICESITKGRNCGGSSGLTCAFGVANPNVIKFSLFVLSFDFGPPTWMWVSILFYFLVCCFISLACFGFQFNLCVLIVFYLLVIY